MIEQVELRPVRLADVEALAELYASERAFLAPFDPIRPDEFYTAEGQRIEVEHALAQRAAGSRYRFVIEADGELVGTLGIGNVVGLRIPVGQPRLLRRPGGQRPRGRHACGRPGRRAGVRAAGHAPAGGGHAGRQRGLAAGAREERVRADRPRPRLPADRGRDGATTSCSSGWRNERHGCGRCARTSTRPVRSKGERRLRRPDGRVRRHGRASTRRRRPNATLRRCCRRASPDQGPLDYVIEADGLAVGCLWFAERELDGRPSAYLYDIHDRRATRAATATAGRRCWSSSARRPAGACIDLSLNVFGGNAPARGLYSSLGWAETAVTMTKQLEA